MQKLDLSLFFGNQTTQGLSAYVVAVLASVLFGLAFSIIYRWYFARSQPGIGVNKSFMLLAPAITAIFLVIQFSLPLSLGLLGALSFVRFRTPIKEPEEIGFLMLVIAVSLASAVFRFEVGLILIGVVSCIAWAKNRNFPGSRLLSNNQKYDMFVTSNDKDIDISSMSREIQNMFDEKGLKSHLMSVSKSEGQLSLHLQIQEPKKATGHLTDLVSKLSDLTKVSNINLVYDPV